METISISLYNFSNQRLTITGTSRQVEIALSNALANGWKPRPRSLRHEQKIGKATQVVTDAAPAY